MKAVALLILCLFLLVALPGVVKFNNGYYFSLQAVLEHFGAFPSFPALDWGGDFLTSGAALLGYGILFSVFILKFSCFL